MGVVRFGVSSPPVGDTTIRAIRAVICTGHSRFEAKNLLPIDLDTKSATQARETERQSESIGVHSLLAALPLSILLCPHVSSLLLAPASCRYDIGPLDWLASPFVPHSVTLARFVPGMLRNIWPVSHQLTFILTMADPRRLVSVVFFLLFCFSQIERANSFVVVVVI